MTSRRRVVVATASYGGGHHEIANAIAEALRARGPEGARVAGIDLLERCAPRSARLARVAYGGGESFFPDGAGDLAEIARSNGDDPVVRELMSGGTASALAALTALRPDAVIATHPVAGAIAAELRDHLGCMVATVAPDLGHARAWVHPACDVWFVGTPETRDALVRRGVDWAAVVVSGAPVREASASGGLKASLGLEERFTAAVVDTGRADARTIADELAARGVQVVTNLPSAGETRGKRRAARPVAVVPVETRLADMAAAADVLVAGPCGASQWVAPACSTPMIVVEPVPALEAASVHVLVCSGAALLASDAIEAARQASYLMRHPERTASMRADAGRLGRPAAARSVAERLLAQMR